MAAKNTYKSNTFKKPGKKTKKKNKFRPFKDHKFILVIGFFLIIFSLYLSVSFISYLFTYQADQSVVQAIDETGLKASGLEAENWLGLFGALLSYYFIFNWFGIAAFLIPPFLFILGYKVVFRKEIISPLSAFKFVFFFIFWTSLLMGYLTLNTEEINSWSFLSGGIGYELAFLFDSLIGWGTFLFLLFSLIVFIIYFFDINTIFSASSSVEKAESGFEDEEETSTGFGKWYGKDKKEEKKEDEDDDFTSWTITREDQKEKKKNDNSLELAIDDRISSENNNNTHSSEKDNSNIQHNNSEGPNNSSSLELQVSEQQEEDKIVEKVENYDPTLDLSSYQYPGLDLLVEHSSGNIEVTKEELEQNKDKIVETLINFKIGISNIKATIGPTVTLYEK